MDSSSELYSELSVLEAWASCLNYTSLPVLVGKVTLTFAGPVIVWSDTARYSCPVTSFKYSPAARQNVRSPSTSNLVPHALPRSFVL